MASVAAIYILYIAASTAPLPFFSPPPPQAGPEPQAGPTSPPPTDTPPPHSTHFPDIPLYPYALLVDYRPAAGNEGARETYVVADGSSPENVLGFYRAEMPRALLKHAHAFEDSDVYYKGDDFYLVAVSEKGGDVYLYISTTEKIEPDPLPTP